MSDMFGYYDEDEYIDPVAEQINELRGEVGYLIQTINESDAQRELDEAVELGQWAVYDELEDEARAEELAESAAIFQEARGGVEMSLGRQLTPDEQVRIVEQLPDGGDWGWADIVQASRAAGLDPFIATNSSDVKARNAARSARTAYMDERFKDLEDS